MEFVSKNVQKFFVKIMMEMPLSQKNFKGIVNLRGRLVMIWLNVSKQKKNMSGQYNLNKIADDLLLFDVTNQYFKNRT